MRPIKSGVAVGRVVNGCRLDVCDIDAMEERRLRRFPHFSYKGFIRYSLTISTHERRPLFTTSTLVETVREQFVQPAPACGFAVIAYCFMPDHLHAFVEGLTAGASLPIFIRKAKQMSGYYGKRVAGQAIWQDGYYDRILRANEDSRSVIAYLLDNPVRAGLVASAAEYPFSGSGLCSLQELLEFGQFREDHPGNRRM
jgi:REP element-mobilizing transposase RayT